MSNGTSSLPLSLSIAPFPEGFQGDMDETFQQAVQLMSGSIQGNFITGYVLAPGSTLPTTNQGVIAIDGVWYFWDTTTGQYLPQSTSVKASKNYAKNCVYQVQQYTLGIVPAGISNPCDMALVRSTLGSVLATSQVTGPPADPNGDYCPSALHYTVGPILVPTPASTDLYAHEHLIEGSDIAMIQGEVLTLSFHVLANVTGTYSVYLTSGGRDASYVANFTIATANTWTRVVVPAIPALPTSMGTWNFGEGQTGLYIGVGLCVGSQWHGTVNSWQSGFFAGSSQNSNLCTVVNNQISVTGIKLEAASAATYLSVPSFEADYDDCIRYYFTSFIYQSMIDGDGLVFYGAGSNTAYGSGTLFPRRMCKLPTVVPYSTNSLAPGTVLDLDTGLDLALATLPATQKGIDAVFTLTGATTDAYNALFVADARLS